MSGKNNRRRNAQLWNSTLALLRWSSAFEAERGRPPTVLEKIEALPQWHQVRVSR